MGQSRGWRPIEWGATSRAEDETGSDAGCDGSAESRLTEWNRGGDRIALPMIVEHLCLYRSEEEASQAYEDRTLAVVAGEYYPNLDDASQYTPDGWNPSVLSADDAELGCGLGNPNVYCGSWVYRARYGTVLVDLTFIADGSALSLAQFLRLAQDAEIRIATGRSL